jgi:hypothetical protein
MIRLAWLLILPLAVAGCASNKAGQPPKDASGYAGTIQKVFRVVRQGQDLPGVKLLGKWGAAFGPKLRQSSETLQYVVRTPQGQIMAQSDAEFSVGDCVEVVPHSARSSGPAFRYGEAQLLRSESCTL